jgi:hypothetical protein
MSWDFIGDIEFLLEATTNELLFLLKNLCDFRLGDAGFSYIFRNMLL